VQHFINSFFQLLSQHYIIAYGVIFSVTFLESFAFIGLVVPGTLFAVSAGFFASKGMFNLLTLIITASFGAILADLASYYLGHFYGDKIIARRFYKKYEPYIEKGNRFFSKHGGKSVLLGRFIGFTRPIIPFLAGLLNMNPVKFWIYAVVSGFSWGFSYIGAGYLFGESWKMIEAWIGKFGVILLTLFIIGYLIKKVLIWLGSLVIRFLQIILSLIDDMATAIISNSYIKQFRNQHPALIGFIKKRFSKKEASGLLLTIGFLLTAFFSYFFIAIIEDIIFHDPLTQLDVTFFYMLQEIHSRFSNKFFVFFNTLASSVPILIFFTIVICILIINRKLLEASFYLFNFLGGLIFLSFMKYLFHRPRPNAMYHFYTALNPSFPCGHTFVSVTLFGFALYYIVKFIKSNKIKTSALLVYFLLVILIGFSRIYLGVNWFSDVLGAYFAGFIWLSSIITTYEYVVKKYQISITKAPIKIYATIFVAFLIIAGVSGITFYSIKKTESVVKQAKIFLPVYKEFTGDLLTILHNQIYFFTQTIFGKPASPIQAIFLGNLHHFKEALKSAKFKEIKGISIKDVYRFVKVIINNKYQASLPAVFYYYDNRTQESTWIKKEEKKPYPRIVLRLWRAHVKINGKEVIVATIDREKGLYYIFSRFRFPIPICDISLPKARKKFLFYFSKSKLNFQIVKIEKEKIGRNILEQRYFFDGKVILITD